MLTRPTINVSSENFHHVFFRVTGDADLGAVSVGGDVELFVVVEQAEDVGGGWGCEAWLVSQGFWVCCQS